jgi:ATP-dependent RNA helicase SUPV3L1/SUV3
MTVATLRAGKQLLVPEVQLDAGLAVLPQDVQQRVRERLSRWIGAQLERHVPVLVRMDAASRDAETPAAVRAVIAQLVDAGGVMARRSLDDALAAVPKEERAHLRKAGVVIGVLDLFHPGLIKPGAAQWRMVLQSLKLGKPLVALPPAGAVLLPATGEGAWTDEIGARVGGFRRLDDVYLRLDIAERLARAAHEAIAKGEPYLASNPMIVSMGLSEPAFLELMRQAGFRAVADAPEGSANWAFKGRPRPRVRPEHGGGNKDAAGRGRGKRPADRAPRTRDGDAVREPRGAPSGGHPGRSTPAYGGQATGKALAGLAALLGREE